MELPQKASSPVVTWVVSRKAMWRVVATPMFEVKNPIGSR